MKLRLLVTLICASLGSGFVHADDAVVAPDDVAAAARLPRIDLTPQLLHQFLVAEMAGHRGQMALAVGAYRDLAKSTRDPRVARRAAEIAIYARQYDAALDAARIWVDADPDSQGARQMLASLLAASGRGDELSVHVAKMLAAAGPDIGPALLRLNRVFARSTDKAAVQRLIDEVTAPYLGMAEAHFARSIAAVEAQDLFRSRAEVERALALRPDWEQAALLRAQVSPRAEVLDGLKRFVADNPKAREARLAYARALVGEKRFEEARREFADILADNPDNADVIYAVAVLSLQLGDTALAEVHLKRLVELGYSEAGSARLYLGQIAEEKKRWDDAIQWYSQVGAGEQYLAAQVRLASVLAQTGRLDEARRHLQEARAGSPRERVQLILGEAQLLREARRNDEAFQVLEAGLAALPDQPELLYEAGLAAEKIGRPAVLEKYLRQLIQIKPDHAHAYNALGYSLADRGERLDEAQQLIDKALLISPEDPFILDSKGWLLYRRGDSGAALDVLKKALALRADPEIAAHCGEVLWVLGRRDEALKTWSDAVQASPGNEALAATIKRFKP
ncbi:MAG: tetratricopeptide repeat protein [Rhodocyclaceae bacterium]|nr:tetratricopeptide repeat protein [Rhodocyclaceae bacterium]